MGFGGPGSGGLGRISLEYLNSRKFVYLNQHTYN